MSLRGLAGVRLVMRPSGCGGGFAAATGRGSGRRTISGCTARRVRRSGFPTPAISRSTSTVRKSGPGISRTRRTSTTTWSARSKASKCIEGRASFRPSSTARARRASRSCSGRGRAKARDCSSIASIDRVGLRGPRRGMRVVALITAPGSSPTGCAFGIRPPGRGARCAAAVAPRRRPPPVVPNRRFARGDAWRAPKSRRRRATPPRRSADGPDRRRGSALLGAGARLDRPPLMGEVGWGEANSYSLIQVCWPVPSSRRGRTSESSATSASPTSWPMGWWSLAVLCRREPRLARPYRGPPRSSFWLFASPISAPSCLADDGVAPRGCSNAHCLPIYFWWRRWAS